MRNTVARYTNGVVVQLVRMPACHAGGRGFESRPYRQTDKKAPSLDGAFLYSILWEFYRKIRQTHPSGSANGVNIPLVVRQIPVLLNFATVSDRVLSKRVLSKSASSPRFPSTLRLLCLFARIKREEHTNSAFSCHLHAVSTIYTINYCYYIVIPFIPNLFHYLNLILS